MNPSRIRQKLTRGQIAWCAKACYADPELVELMSSVGFDGIWICLEHKRLDPATTYSLIQACRLGGADAIMRVKPANYSELLPLLEAGAKGIMLPRVRGPEEVREVVAAMKFPPLGRRGYDAIHADARFGLGSPADYMEQTNRETLLIVQIEEPEVIQHVDSIAAIPGVDVLFVGPADLSLGLGKFGQPESPELAAVLKMVAAACRHHGKVAGIPCAGAQVEAYAQMGCRFFNVLSDYHCLINGFAKTRSELGPLWDGMGSGQALCSRISPLFFEQP
jgi:4-hydroxy-2-oxoheptanedioate aldolase